MRERPILFSADMVRGIRDGRKTQTRRVIVPQPVDSWMTGPNWSEYYKDGKKNLWIEHPTKHTEIKCPYGVPGDRLWVRETWYARNYGGKPCSRVDYAADYARPDFLKENGSKKHPSIFMPRWASRIALEIVKVRVEHVQDISEADAVAEGFSDNGAHGSAHCTARYGFHCKWDSLNAKRGFAWDENPWVWCIEFRKSS